MALVTITTEERSYKQAYWFNRNISADGTVTSNTGTASRDVTVSQTTYRGDKASVRAALATAHTNGSQIVLRKIDGPWWEGDATLTTYGTWTIVMDNPPQ